MVLGLDGGVCKPVGAVGDHSGEDVVERHNAGVVEQVNEEGDGVVDGSSGTEVVGVEGSRVGIGDIEVVDQSGGRVLEGNSGSPATEGGEESEAEGEPVELSLVGSGVSGFVLGGVVLVHGGGNVEGGEDDLNAEGKEEDDPGDFESTEGAREPSLSAIGEEVGSLISGGRGPVLRFDGGINGSISGIGGGEDTRGDGNQRASRFPESGEMSGEDGLTLVSEPGNESTGGHDEEWHKFVVLVSSVDLSHLGEHFSPGEAVGENACVFSGDAVNSGAIIASAGRVISITVSAALSRVSITIEIKVLDLGNESVNIIEVEASASKAAHYFLIEN